MIKLKCFNGDTLPDNIFLNISVVLLYGYFRPLSPQCLLVSWLAGFDISVVWLFQASVATVFVGVVAGGV